MQVRSASVFKLGCIAGLIAAGAVFAQPNDTSTNPPNVAQSSDADALPDFSDVPAVMTFAQQQLDETKNRCEQLSKQSEKQSKEGEDTLKENCVTQAQEDCEIYQQLLTERLALLEQVKDNPALFSYHAGVLSELVDNAKSSQLKTADCIGKSFEGANSQVDSQAGKNTPRGVDPGRVSPSDGGFNPYIPSPASGVI